MRRYGEVDKWTVDRVKEELPLVRVRGIDGTIYVGEIKGRKQKFPRVFYEYETGHGVKWINAGEFAWETLARSLNKGTVLEV
jgi:hypothetical protein